MDRLGGIMVKSSDTLVATFYQPQSLSGTRSPEWLAAAVSCEKLASSPYIKNFVFGWTDSVGE